MSPGQFDPSFTLTSTWCRHFLFLCFVILSSFFHDTPEIQPGELNVDAIKCVLIKNQKNWAIHPLVSSVEHKNVDFIRSQVISEHNPSSNNASVLKVFIVANESTKILIPGRQGWLLHWLLCSLMWIGFSAVTISPIMSVGAFPIDVLWFVLWNHL